MIVTMATFLLILLLTILTNFNALIFAIDNYPIISFIWLILIIVDVVNFCKQYEEFKNKNKNS